MKTRYMKPKTEVMAFNFGEGILTSASVEDKDGNKQEVIPGGGTTSGTGNQSGTKPPVGGAKQYNAWETWD